MRSILVISQTAEFRLDSNKSSHRRDVQERRQDDICQGSCVAGLFKSIQLQPRSGVGDGPISFSGNSKTTHHRGHEGTQRKSSDLQMAHRTKTIRYLLNWALDNHEKPKKKP
jgi:hypothetical protein